MFSSDLRSAAARRDAGIRKISRLTWRAGMAGVICSAVIAVAFGHHAQGQAAPPGQSGTIVVPHQPPAPAQGGGQVTSGAS
ncbi:MAG TPA: hypothetical protein VMV07_03955 [Streptosporangiaceae bacterium]|nr:hypothetical protein [Streptosporangiaceae bacterium]